MKKIAIIGLMSVCAAGAYAQGTLVFNNNVAGTIVTHIYSPNPSSPAVEVTGNTPTETPGGTAVYGGTPIGGSSGAAGLPVNYAFGNNFTAQIYALYTSGNTVQPIGSLVPVSQYVTTLATTAGQGAGFIVAVSPANDPGIPNPNASSDAINNGTVDNRATVSLAAWYNAGGTITSLAAAVAAHVPEGQSAVFNINNLGEPSSIETEANGTPTAGTLPANMLGLRSFSLTATPEPSTIALGLMGACAFLARRKKK
jgi:hypothetical protein